MFGSTAAAARAARMRGARTVTVLSLFAVSVTGLSAQELSLKREIPGEGTNLCSPVDAPPNVGPEERAEATRLGSTASQSLILGDRERARDLLTRAIEIDPGSADLAYQLGRVHEDLGSRDEAVEAYCRVMAIAPSSSDANDAQSRLLDLALLLEDEVPFEARTAFREGLELADAGNLETSANRFISATMAAPSWADAHYNLGVVRARLGLRAEAANAFQRYLDLAPEAPDGIAVSQQVGQLTVSGRVPSPGAALALGMIPGMGHFYSGRPVAGFSILALAGGAAGAALFVEDVTVTCIVEPDESGNCPSGQVLSETSERPLLVPGLGAAAVVTLIGAIEAFAKVRGGSEPTEPFGLDVGPARLLPPSVSASSSGVDVNFLRLNFR